MVKFAGMDIEVRLPVKTEILPLRVGVVSRNREAVRTNAKS
jgi:hypothetical protein